MCPNVNIYICCIPVSYLPMCRYTHLYYIYQSWTSNRILFLNIIHVLDKCYISSISLYDISNRCIPVVTRVMRLWCFPWMEDLDLCKLFIVNDILKVNKNIEWWVDFSSHFIFWVIYFYNFTDITFHVCL